MTEDYRNDGDLVDRGPWETPVVRKDNGVAIGATFFLTDDVLKEMNIELEAQDRLQYAGTRDGKVIISNITE